MRVTAHAPQNALRPSHFQDAKCGARSCRLMSFWQYCRGNSTQQTHSNQHTKACRRRGSCVTESTVFRNSVEGNVRIGSHRGFGLSLVTLCLYHEIRKLVPTIKKHLMRHLSRNPHHVA